MAVQPFTIMVPGDRLDAILAAVARYDWATLPDAGGWRSGVNLADLQRLVDHWRTRFDWRAAERRLNALPRFTADLLGQRLHFVHARGDGSRPPLFLLDGRPASSPEAVPFNAVLASFFER